MTNTIYTVRVNDYYGEELDSRCGASVQALENWARESWEGACHCTTFEITNEENETILFDTVA